MNNKFCKSCKNERDKENFGKSVKTKDGLKSECNTCFGEKINKILSNNNLTLDYLFNQYIIIESIEKVAKNINMSKYILEEIFIFNNILDKAKNKIKHKYIDNGKLCNKCDTIKPISEFCIGSKGYYRNNCNICRSQESKKYREKNPEKMKIWRKNNKKHILNYAKNYIRSENSMLALRLRQRLNNALKGDYKSGSAVKDLGCSIEELKLWFEKQFYPNPETGEIMNWNNYGFKGWHIDHIKPLANFDLKDKNQLKLACHYTNLQPLWAKDNFRKNKYVSW